VRPPQDHVRDPSGLATRARRARNPNGNKRLCAFAGLEPVTLRCTATNESAGGPSTMPGPAMTQCNKQGGSRADRQGDQGHRTSALDTENAALQRAGGSQGGHREERKHSPLT